MMEDFYDQGDVGNGYYSNDWHAWWHTDGTRKRKHNHWEDNDHVSLPKRPANFFSRGVNLVKACESGNLDEVKELIGDRLGIVRYSQNRPLRAAAEFNHLAIVKFLIEQKADIHAANDYQDDLGFPAKDAVIRHCCKHGNLEMLEFLLKCHSSVPDGNNHLCNDYKLENLVSPIQIAVQHGHFAVARTMWRHGVREPSVFACWDLKKGDPVEFLETFYSDKYRMRQRTQDWGPLAKKCCLARNLQMLKWVMERAPRNFPISEVIVAAVSFVQIAFQDFDILEFLLSCERPFAHDALRPQIPCPQYLHWLESKFPGVVPHATQSEPVILSLDALD